MNTILQKRIEEAAEKIVCSVQCTYFALDKSCHCYEKKFCMKTAEEVLQNQWISVNEALPEYDECVLTHFEGEDEVGEMFSQRSKPSDNLTLDKNGFQVVGFTEVTYWMQIPKKN